jgi:hypothetical protein
MSYIVHVGISVMATCVGRKMAVKAIMNDITAVDALTALIVLLNTSQLNNCLVIEYVRVFFQK